MKYNTSIHMAAGRLARLNRRVHSHLGEPCNLLRVGCTDMKGASWEKTAWILVSNEVEQDDMDDNRLYLRDIWS